MMIFTFIFTVLRENQLDGIPADLDLKRIIFHGRVSRLEAENLLESQIF